MIPRFLTQGLAYAASLASTRIKAQTLEDSQAINLDLEASPNSFSNSSPQRSRQNVMDEEHRYMGLTKQHKTLIAQWKMEMARRSEFATVTQAGQDSNYAAEKAHEKAISFIREATTIKISRRRPVAQHDENVAYTHEVEMKELDWDMVEDEDFEEPWVLTSCNPTECEGGFTFVRYPEFDNRIDWCWRRAEDTQKVVLSRR